MSLARFVLLCSLTGCGTIVIGVDRDGGPSDVSVSDAGDTGVSDSGVRDAGTPDTGGTPDAGPCTPRVRPPPPATWPYPLTQIAYQSQFWDAMPGRATCSITGCHGVGSTAPVMPATAAELTGQNLEDAIEQLWVRALPTNEVGATGPVAVLKWHHDPAGNGGAPPYNAAQVAFVEGFLERSYNCAWKNAAPSGPNECPPPTVDVSACR